MEQRVYDDEVRLSDIIVVLLRYKRMIIGITLAAMVGVFSFTVVTAVIPPEKSVLPNMYSPRALMLINSSSSGDGLSSLISSSGLGGLASLTGMNLSSNKINYKTLAVYLVGTNDFLDDVVARFGLVERYKIKDYQKTKSRRELRKRLSAKVDDDTGVFSLSYSDIDPRFAQEVVNYCTALLEKRFAGLGLDKNRLAKENLEVNLANSYKEIVRLQGESQNMMNSVNQGRTLSSGSSVMLEATRIELELSAQQSVYTQLKTQYELIKVQLASETPIFQILEFAEVPERKSSPSRGMLCIVISMASFFFSLILAFVLNAIDSLRKDPETIAKFEMVSK